MSPPLRVPLEVLERILFFTFLPRSSSPHLSPNPPSSSLTNSSSLILPALGTSHILLVSHGVRKLSLPLYYHSISIADDTHWAIFLDPTHGLLVGDLNKERVSFVKEHWINVHDQARIPIDVEQVKPVIVDGKETPARVLVELTRVVLPKVSRLVFFIEAPRGGTEEHRSIDQESEGGSSEVKGEQPHEGEGGEEEVHWTSRSLEAYLEANEGLHSSFWDVDFEVSGARNDSIFLFLDSSSLVSLQIKTTLDLMFQANRSLLPFHDSTLPHTPFILYPSAPIDFDDPESIAWAVEAFSRSLVTSLRFDRCLAFEGFPRRVWELTREEWLGPRHHGMTFWGQNWTWRTEDGTLVRLKEMFGEGLE